MNCIKDKEMMKLALKEAFLAFEEDEVPVGAIVVKDGSVVGRGHNHRESNLDISSHAEIEAIRDASKNLGRWNLEGCTLYVTLEPCLMCSGAIMQSRISRIVYGADDESKGAIKGRYFVFDDPKAETHPLITPGILGDECSEVLKTFFNGKRQVL